MPVAGRAKLRHNPYIDGVKNSVHMHGGGIGLDAQYRGSLRKPSWHLRVKMAIWQIFAKISNGS